MITRKRKIIKKSKFISNKERNNGENKCPKKVKDCAECKIVDCPEEQ